VGCLLNKDGFCKKKFLARVGAYITGSVGRAFICVFLFEKAPMTETPDLNRRNGFLFGVRARDCFRPAAFCFNKTTSRTGTSLSPQKKISQSLFIVFVVCLVIEYLRCSSDVANYKKSDHHPNTRLLFLQRLFEIIAPHLFFKNEGPVQTSLKTIAIVPLFLPGLNRLAQKNTKR
jgi:hypothetical protein